MARTYLSWIDDYDLMSAVDTLVSQFTSELERPVQGHYVGTATHEVLYKAFTGGEINRQNQQVPRLLRTLSIEFHKQILIGIEGWIRNPHREADLRNDSELVFAKLLSSRFDWNSSRKRNQEKLIRDLLDANRGYSYFVVYLDEPKANLVFEAETDRVKVMTGDEFYAFVSGVSSAREQLLSVLPTLISEYLPGLVFLSYSRKDSEAMRRVRDTFKNNDIDVWTDEKLTPGTEQWTQAIDNAIQECAAFVVLLSPDAKVSPWVNNEILAAQAHKKRIFAFLVDGIETNAVPLSLMSVQRINATDNFEAKLAQLTVEVKDHMRDLRGI